MKAKLLTLITTLFFSGNVLAEYYLVYPVANLSCNQCYPSTHKVKHRKYVVHRKRSSHRVVKYHRPCGGVVMCSSCGEYVQTTCGRPDYIVYSAHSEGCVTYEGVLQGEQ